MSVDPLMGVKCPTCGRNNFQWRMHCMNCQHPFGPADKRDELDRFRGAAISLRVDIPYVHTVRGPYFDENNYERAERVNGCVPCPRCELLWPFFEEIEAWREFQDGTHRGIEWGPGTAYCPNCEKVFVDTFDGCFELNLEGR